MNSQSKKKNKQKKETKKNKNILFMKLCLANLSEFRIILTRVFSLVFK